MARYFTTETQRGEELRNHRGEAETQSERKKQHGESAEGAEVALRRPNAAVIEDRPFPRVERRER